ncbi:hypothetical protein [Erwinia sp.]|uniref:hypothetical protein n=1 Tax=Erwinia citreus TaxID=558 RepID=UPI003C712C6B
MLPATLILLIFVAWDGFDVASMFSFATVGNIFANGCKPQSIQLNLLNLIILVIFQQDSGSLTRQLMGSGVEG